MSDETPLPFSPLSFSKEECKGSCIHLNTTIGEARKARAVWLNTTHSFVKLTLRTLVLAPSSLSEIPWTKHSIPVLSLANGWYDEGNRELLAVVLAFQ